MIHDSLHALSAYRGLYRGLDVLIDWLAEHDPAGLPVGSNEIDGKRVFANVMEATTRKAEDAHYEFHHQYMDVQIDLTGSERFKTARGAMEDLGDFDAVNDAGLCDAVEGASEVFDGTLGSGRFVLFLVDEPHMPMLTAPGEEPAPVKKICFKVLADQFWDEA